MATAHRNNFDGVRLLAASCVFASHQLGLTGLGEPRIGRDGWTLGYLGVAIFFSISGYLVAQSWERDPHVGRFLARRGLRLLPGLWAVILLLSFAAVAWAWHAGDETYLWGALRFLQNLIPLWFDNVPLFPNGMAADGPLWTIPYEVRCYLVLAAVALAFRARARTVVLLTVWGAVIASLLLHDGAAFLRRQGLEVRLLEEGARSLQIPSTVFGMCSFFAAGALCWWYQPSRTLLAAAATAGVLLFASGYQHYGLFVLCPTVAITVGRTAWPVLRAGGRFGDLSYGVYVWAWPMQILAIWWLGRQPLATALLAIPLTLVCAWLSWHYVEQPALALKPKARLSRPDRVAEGESVAFAQGA